MVLHVLLVLLTQLAHLLLVELLHGVVLERGDKSLTLQLFREEFGEVFEVQLSQVGQGIDAQVDELFRDFCVEIDPVGFEPSGHFQPGVEFVAAGFRGESFFFVVMMVRVVVVVVVIFIMISLGGRLRGSFCCDREKRRREGRRDELGRRSLVGVPG